ncbi:Ger(x)C family spore germination protein [Alkalihalobacillus oceani]|uniref:Ger(X)C family spore germination protein n=1 Tax=Halalkalibacter oceani TaxID=1653776 RepID=A0A9X2DMS4_9BACI|nr:Ger(x)C family spore germination protein [Halalkalibacter oceani]MCM3713696.1 Ger(x)C family spore germination protein [Halalkalibacter oceani]
MKRAISTILILFILTGCWDSRDIEELGFVLGIAFDPVKEEERHEDHIEEELGEAIGDSEAHERFFRKTYQIAVPQDSQSGEDIQSHFNLTSIGLTNFKVARNLATRSSRALNSEHLKVLIINEELVRNGMLEHLADFYLRDHEMRRRVLVLISKGEAKANFDVKVPLEKMPALYIREVLENYEKTLQMPKYVEMGDVTSFIINQYSYIIPRIVSGKTDIKVAGAAVFDGQENKMVGWLGEAETEGYNWVVGDAENGVLEVNYEDKGVFVYESFSAKTSLDFERRGEQNVFTIDVKTEGSFAEKWIEGIDVADIETNIKLQQAVEEKIKAEINQIVEKMQNEYSLDIFRFGMKINRKDPKYWEEIKDRWDGEDGLFKDAIVHTNVSVKVRNYMTEEKLK